MYSYGIIMLIKNCFFYYSRKTKNKNACNKLNMSLVGHILSTIKMPKGLATRFKTKIVHTLYFTMLCR